MSTVFASKHYQEHNKARQEHLASLGLPIDGKTVLEVGAGIGDHTKFFLDRGCIVTSTEAREGNLLLLRKQYPQIRAEQLDLDNPSDVLDGEAYDIVYCYGTLYHLSRPSEALEYMAKHCSGMLLLETCVQARANAAVNPCDEAAPQEDQSYHGRGCRPARSWVWRTLKGLFEHVYMPTTQPTHPEFPLDWCRPPRTGLTRSVFVASRKPLGLPFLVEEVLMVQTHV
jgi:hypothetical protein